MTSEEAGKPRPSGRGAVTEPKIVEAVGCAVAASPQRSRAVYAREMETAMRDAIMEASRLGVTDAREVQARMNEARIKVREKYKEMDRAAIADALMQKPMAAR